MQEHLSFELVAVMIKKRVLAPSFLKMHVFVLVVWA